MVLPLAHLVCLLALGAEPRPLPLVVTDLGSPDFTKREAATETLTRARIYTLAELEAALKDPALTAEQRLRLDEAVLRAFADSPRGALGVNFNQRVNTAEVNNVLDGFPAGAVLKPGDVITEIDGVAVSSRVGPDGGWSTVRSLIISHDPGDKVPVVVQRNGAPVALTVTLGDFNGLGRGSAIDTYEFRAALDNRLARTIGRTQPVAINATALRGKRDNTWDNRGSVDLVDSIAAARANAGEVPSVTAGASPDHARQIDRGEQRAFGGKQDGGFRQFNNNNAFVFGGARGMGGGGDDLTKMSDRELAEMRMRLSQWLNSVAMFAGQQDINRGQRNQFAEMQGQVMRELSAVNRELEKRKAARQDAALEPAPPAPLPPPAADSKPDQKADKP